MTGMRSFKKSISQLTPKQRAAFLLAARDLMNELGLPAPSSNEILVATRGSRSAAYEGKVQVFHAVGEALNRKRGRPRRSANVEVADSRSAGLVEKMLRFLWSTPGAVGGSSNTRRRYSSDLVEFVLELRAEYADLSHFEFGNIIGISQGTIKAWVKDGGRPASNPEQRYSKRRLARKERVKRIIEILHQKPAIFGLNRTSWTQATIAEVYQKIHGQKIGRTTIVSLLKESKHKWKRAKKVLMSPDPDYREKVELLLSTLQNLQPGELFFFIDELGPLRVKRYGGRDFVPKHETFTVPQVQHHKGSITMAGALSATANQVTWFYSPSKNTLSMIDLIELLFNQHPGATRLFVTWDAAAWHRSAMLVEWIDSFNAETARSGTGPEIWLVPLPSSSQFLDVLEAVFSGMKRAVIHNSDYKSEKEMKTAISRHFKDRNSYFEKIPNG